MLELIKSVNLALRFLLELCALGALGYWGFKTGSTTSSKIGLGLGVPLVAAVVWGRSCSLTHRCSYPGCWSCSSKCWSSG